MFFFKGLFVGSTFLRRVSQLFLGRVPQLLTTWFFFFVLGLFFTTVLGAATAASILPMPLTGDFCYLLAHAHLIIRFATNLWKVFKNIDSLLNKMTLSAVKKFSALKRNFKSKFIFGRFFALRFWLVFAKFRCWCSFRQK